MNFKKTIPVMISVLAGMMLSAPSETHAQTKQGGGAFETPKPKKPKTTTRKKATKPAAKRVSIAGKWSVRITCKRRFLNSRATYTIKETGGGQFVGTAFNHTGKVPGTISGRVTGTSLQMTADYVDLLGQPQRDVWRGTVISAKQISLPDGKGKWAKGCQQAMSR